MGKEVAEAVLVCAESDPAREFVGFLDDRADLHGQSLLGYPVLGGVEWAASHPDVEIALGFGHPWTRYRVVQNLRATGSKFATIVPPRAEISPSACIGEGTVIFSGCVISSGAQLGSFVYLNYLSIISHDAQVSDYACIMGHAVISGEVRVGEGAFIGAGAITRQGVSIGDWSLIGAGAAVVGDIPPLCVAVGVPARPIRHYQTREEMPCF
jgi:sugar O-acyltransferase (sialic acid O-acetyltransferase NeuD family)